ncbi:MAG TPA: hypothetical protein VLS89_14145 [Candidatus Nanopelagicales bacterium]|nr:hypothetical protein [Candidatus Nanopelagicales bacterium]
MRTSRCHYCETPGAVLRGLGATRAASGRNLICHICVRVAYALDDFADDPSVIIAYDHVDALKGELRSARFRRRVLALRRRFSCYCEYCGRLEREAGMLLAGASAICVRCVNDLHRQLHSNRDVMAPIRGIDVLHFGFVPQGSKASWRPIFERLDGRRPMETFSRELSGGEVLVAGHGPDGLRFQFHTDSRTFPGWVVSGSSASPPVGISTIDLEAACWFCGQVRSRIPHLGLGKRSGAVICYECVAVGYDAFCFDRAVLRRAERPPRRSPVTWVTSPPPRSHRLAPYGCRRLGVL